MKKWGTIAVILAVSLSLTLIIVGVTYKPSIHEASYYDLIQIDHIGDIRAERILAYLEINPNAKLKELVLVDDVGEVIISNLKRKFK